MWNFIKKLLKLIDKDVQQSFEVEKEVFPSDKTYPLGAINDPIDKDNRDIPLATVQAPVDIPEIFETDLSMFPVFDQGVLGTCVAHAYALVKMFLDFTETKKPLIYSRRFLYVLARRFARSVNTDEASNQGLSPRLAAKVLSTAGIIEENGQENNTLPHSKYVDDFIVTEEARIAGMIHRSGKFAFPLHDEKSFAQAIYQNKVVTATIGIDWSQIEYDGTTHAPKKLAGTHQVVFVGRVMHRGALHFKYRNSWSSRWGVGGYGFVPVTEIEQVLYDAIVFVDVPDNLLERAKNMQYIFTADMRIGSSGTGVKELQKRLIEYGLLNGIPDGKFGKNTFSAVCEFQNLKGLTATGVVGAGTRGILNKEVPQSKIKSKLDRWIEAGIKMEGAKPSLNNPGNIKCSQIKHKDATGIDYRGFCIFPTYEKGYNAMRDLFIRAATPPDGTYWADMTLYEFYAVYAPSSDKNNPNEYAEVVAKYIGVSPTTKIKDLI